MIRQANYLPPPKLLERLLDPSRGLIVFSLALTLVYAVAPLVIYVVFPLGDHYLRLAGITLCAIVAMVAGARISMFDYRFKRHAPRLFISSGRFIFVTWLVFILFIILTFSTAPSIPILSALKGASSNDLSQERGAFLKGREGAAIALLYLSTFLVNTVVPYSIILLYTLRSRLRHLSALLFLLFCISFLQKSLFLNLILPLLAFMAISRQLRRRVFIGLAVGSIALLIATTFLSLGGETGGTAEPQPGDYLSALYAPSSPLDYFLWRSVAVPIFTATDTLVVHAEQFGSRPLLGATSSLLSTIFGVERVNLERFVFEHQFGAWNEIANSNAVFVVDAYVNFGWAGVVAFGLFVGLIFRWFRISEDPAFKSLWVIFAFVLFSAPLIGMLLSNGFAYMLIQALYIRVGSHGRRVT